MKWFGGTSIFNFVSKWKTPTNNHPKHHVKLSRRFDLLLPYPSATFARPDIPTSRRRCLEIKNCWNVQFSSLNKPGINLVLVIAKNSLKSITTHSVCSDKDTNSLRSPNNEGTCQDSERPSRELTFSNLVRVSTHDSSHRKEVSLLSY